MCDAISLFCMQAGKKEQPGQSLRPIRPVQHSTRPKACLLRQAAQESDSQIRASLRLLPDPVVHAHRQE